MQLQEPPPPLGGIGGVEERFVQELRLIRDKLLPQQVCPTGAEAPGKIRAFV